MRTAALLVLAGAIVCLGAAPGDRVPDTQQSAPRSTPVRPAVTVKVCAGDNRQDPACLQANGAINSDGAVDATKARALMQSGTCPCQESGGRPTATIPATN